MAAYLGWMKVFELGSSMDSMMVGPSDKQKGLGLVLPKESKLGSSMDSLMVGSLET